MTFNWGPVSQCVRFALQGKVDDEAMATRLKFNYPGGAGGWYTTDHIDDTTRFGPCLLVTTLPAGTRVLNESFPLGKFFGDSVLPPPTLSALGTVVPMLRLYKPFTTWGVVQHLDLLKNISWGGRIIDNDFLLDEAAKRTFQNRGWLPTNFSDARADAISKSLNIIGQYRLAMSGSNWLSLYTSAAIVPLDPTPLLLPAILSDEYARRISSWIYEKMNGGFTIGRTLYMVQLFIGQPPFPWRFGFGGEPQSQFVQVFVNRTVFLSGAPLDPVRFRAEPVEAPAFGGPFIATAAGVEQLQAVPFLHVDAVPLTDGSGDFEVVFSPVDGSSKQTWAKMRAAGFLSDSDMAQLSAGNSLGSNTQLVVRRSLEALAAGLDSRDPTSTEALRLFYASQFLVSLSNETISHAVQVQMAQMVFQSQPVQKRVFSPLLDLVRYVACSDSRHIFDHFLP